ncbi:MAG: hypothetical protein AB3N23_22115 [Paracoccaceae bacterium]
MRTVCLIPLILLPLPVLADITPEADACINELMAREGNVGGEVLGQEFSEAATMVRLRDGAGVEYECIVWSGPEVAELRPVGNASGDGTAMQFAEGEQRVKFDAGTSGTAMTNALQAESSVQYILDANEGQFLNVDIGSRGGAIDYRILNPDGSELLGLISSDTPYKGQLWQSGDHVIEVVNGGAQPVTFDVGIGVN